MSDLMSIDQPKAVKANKPFTPPSAREMDEAMRPEACQAKDDAGAILSARARMPIALTMRHEIVGPWLRGQTIAIKDVHDHFREAHAKAKSPAPTDTDLDAYTTRLIGLSAASPVYV